MPTSMTKARSRAREGRHSRSRNTTPSSSVSTSIAAIIPTHTAYLELPLSQLEIPTNLTYDSILERHGGSGGIPDPNHLETISKDLKMLTSLASTRGDANIKGMRELSDRRTRVIEEEHDREREQAAKDRQQEERKMLKKEADDEVEERERKPARHKRKDKSVVKDERPLNQGALEVAGPDVLPAPADDSAAVEKLPVSPREQPKSIRATSSPLSEPSPTIPSPTASIMAVPILKVRTESPESDSASDVHQPPPVAAQPQYQTFGTNPLTFDDPTVYEVLPITEDMTDEEKQEIYCVSSFPHDDLSDLIAGTPPNKDFSNAVKPNNQVQAHTFAAYLEGYLRPLKEEDIGFLNERGDRVTPFIIPARGKRHYSELWAEEDGAMSIDTILDSLPANQARGSLDDMNDDVAETDQVSSGPLLSRLLSTMRFEHRVMPNDDRQPLNGTQNGTSDSFAINGDVNGLSHQEGEASTEHSVSAPKVTPIPPATALPEGQRPAASAPTYSHAQLDERLKAELKHIGFMAADDEADYDAHLDDEVAERLRWLQDRLRQVSVINGARKRRVLELAEEQLAYQEYSTILEDLDSQVQQAFLKRARTASKSKKNTKRPGAIGPNGVALGAAGALAKPGIGDLARQLMNRRARWEEKIGPVFRGDIRRVRGSDEGIFEDDELEILMRQERDIFDEEAD